MERYKARHESQDDSECRQGILAKTYYAQNLGSDITQSPTAGVIWDLKDKPSWD